MAGLLTNRPGECRWRRYLASPMFVHSAQAFREAFRALAPPVSVPPLRGILMIRPDGFRLSAQAATDNVYMASGPVDPERAMAQHAAVAKRLRDCGVTVHDLPGDPRYPDATFCNNAFATVRGPHRYSGESHNATAIYGALRHPDRRGEPDRDHLRALLHGLGYTHTCEIRTGFTRPPHENSEYAVGELTGPLVIDHSRRIGYLGLTNRVDGLGAERMSQAFELQITYAFPLVPTEYHTNVVLAILAGRAAVIAADGFARREDAEAIAEVYGDQVLWLTPDQKRAFAGNVLSVGNLLVFMSQTAADALGDASLSQLKTWGFEPQAVEIDELEKGGGSMRCLLCELW